MSPAAFLASSEDKGRHDVPRFVLLDTRSYIAGRPNASTATSKTSNDLPIQVTFCAVPPPDLSYLFVHCPGLEVDPTDLSLAPMVISTDADLILLRVHRDPMARMFPSLSDYFVYKMNPHQSRLDLLPNPYPDRFNDNEIAILSCGGDRYVVATLQISGFTFMLHLYRSGRDGKPGSWISQRVSVEDPQRDRVCPIPKSAHSLMYHETTKVITLGGAKVQLVGSISGEAYSSVTCWMTVPSSVTYHCPCRPRATGINSAMAARTFVATSLSTRAKTLSSMSRWKTPHLMLIPTMNG